MSTIVKSQYAKYGILPTTNRPPAPDTYGLFGIGRAPAIGDELGGADTVTFRRIRGDGFDGVEHDTDADLFARVNAIQWQPIGCYLPWCADDYEPMMSPRPDPAHYHSGAEKRVDTYTLDRDGHRVESDVVAFYLEQNDNDGPDIHDTGLPHIYLSIGDGDNRKADVLLTLESAHELARKLAGLADVGMASRGKPNPNMIDRGEYEAAERAWEVHYAEWAAEQEARQAADERARAEKEARQDAGAEPSRRAREAGKRAGATRFARRFPRLAFTVFAWRISVADRFAFAMGMETALNIQAPKGRPRFSSKDLREAYDLGQRVEAELAKHRQDGES